MAGGGSPIRGAARQSRRDKQIWAKKSLLIGQLRAFRRGVKGREEPPELGGMAMEAKPDFIRPEPFTALTLQDGQRYFAVVELVRTIEAEIEREASIRRRGRPGLSPRRLLLTRAAHHGRRFSKALAPLVGVEG
jgi:hypothetical protein